MTRCAKHGREEVPHIRGKRQGPRLPGCNSAGTAERTYPSPRSGVAAERSYLATEVSGSREETPHARGQGQWLRGATPHLRPGAVADRTYPTSEVSGSQEETPSIRGQRWLGEATSSPRTGAMALKSLPHLRPVAGAGRSQPALEARDSSGEEQHKERWLCRGRRA